MTDFYFIARALLEQLDCFVISLVWANTLSKVLKKGDKWQQICGGRGTIYYRKAGMQLSMMVSVKTLPQKGEKKYNKYIPEQVWFK